MPYITCKDGKTYSKYDQSEYVKKCICEEDAYYKKKYTECMANPNCKKEYDEKGYTMFGLIFVLILACIIFGVFKTK
jgi:hypothetical protein